MDTGTSASPEFVEAASTVALPAFLAALLATRLSETRHSNDTAAAVVATSIAAVPLAIGAASGLGCLWHQCFSDPARALWSNADDDSQPREQERGLTPSFVVLCQMGVEDIVEEEIVTRLQEQGGLDEHTSRSLIVKQDIRGLVMVASGGDATDVVLLGLRTANYVLAYHGW